MSNLYGVLIARHSVFPKAKEEGMPWGVCPVVFTSEHVSTLSHLNFTVCCHEDGTQQTLVTVTADKFSCHTLCSD